MDPPLGLLWSVASAIGVLALGIVCTPGRREHSRGSLAFGLFAVAWGVQILAISVGALVASESVAERLFLASAGAGVLLPYLLVEFAAAYSPGGARWPGWSLLRYGSATLAVTGAVLLAVEPSLLFQGSVRVGDQFYPLWGRLEPMLMGLPRLAAFGLAIGVLYAAVRKAPTTRTKARVGVLFGGLSLYLSYAAGNNLVAFARMAGQTGAASDATFLAGFAVLSLLVLGLGAHALLAARRAPTGPDRRREALVAAALLVPWVVGVAEYILAIGTLPELRLVGLWRLAGVAVIAYGLARWRVYDLPQKVRRAASSATGAAGALAGGATAYGVSALATGAIVGPAIGGVAVTGASLVPSMRLARRWIGPEVPDNPVARDQERFEQRVEAYRAALEDAMSRGTLDEDRGFLADLRERFDITDREDRILRYYAQQAVIPTRTGDPDDAYERLRVLGEGGAGRTWLARDRARDRLVVLKEPLDRWHHEPQVLEAARREAKLAAKVDHPNVVDVEEVVEDDGVPVLVMEHVAGGSLADRLREEGRLPWREAVAVVHDVARGLEAVHAAGVVHRDVKPGNVLLAEDGTAKVTDFGIAQLDTDGDTRVMEEPTPRGTEAYMAPEVLAGDAPGDERSDVYACAALLFTCVYGRPPGEAGPAPVADHVPDALEGVLAEGLARRPEDRYASAETLADALAEVART